MLPFGMVEASMDALPSLLAFRQMLDQQSQLTWRDQQLFWRNPSATAALLTKPCRFSAAEIVITLRLVEQLGAAGGYGFGLLDTHNQQAMHLALEQVESAWALNWQAGAEQQRIVLPPAFDPFEHQQFRLRQAGGQIALAWEAAELGALAFPPHLTQLFLAVQAAEIAIDEVRVTRLAAQ